MENLMSKEYIALSASLITGVITLIAVGVTGFVNFKIHKSKDIADRKKELIAKRLEKLEETMKCFNLYFNNAQETIKKIHFIQDGKEELKNYVTEITEGIERNESLYSECLTLAEIHFSEELVIKMYRIESSFNKVVGSLEPYRKNRDTEKAEETLKHIKKILICGKYIRLSIREEYQGLMRIN